MKKRMVDKIAYTPTSREIKGRLGAYATENEEPEMTASGLTMDEIKNQIDETFIDYGADRGFQVNASHLSTMMHKNLITPDQHTELRAYNRTKYASLPLDM